MAFILFCQIRPLFEEHGNVIEVALIKDKRTGQPQGMYEFCFIVRYLLLYLSYFRFAKRLIGAILSSSSSQFVFDTSFALVGFGCHLFLNVAPVKQGEKCKLAKKWLMYRKSRELVPRIDPILEIMDSVVGALANNKFSWECLFPLL